MRDGRYIIGGADLRAADRGAPDSQPDRRHQQRYILVPDATVGHQHAELVIEGERLYLIDLGSPRGTHVVENGERRRLYEAEVTPDTSVELGRWRCTVADLLSMVDSLQGEASRTG